MLLKNLIKNYPKNLKNLNIKGLALNSKEVKTGYIFFAIKGKKFNGENYITQAINNGASLIVCSKSCNFKNKKINTIKTKNVRKDLAEITSKFYKHKPKNIIAVTGTNGKTSVADFFYQILNLAGIPVATIGTLGIKTKKRIIKTNLTSPDVITLHKNLENLKKEKIDNVIIEASSHGLDQNRLDNLKFKAGIFTNFSQDHLDYHKSMKAYLNAKLSLFSNLLPKKSFVISDKSLREYLFIKKISKKRKLKFLDIEELFYQLKNLPISLIGSFQLKNLSMALHAARICNLRDKIIFKTVKKIKNVDGRLELIKEYPNNVKVFIDYAHTPDALQEAIKSLKQKYNANITLVFGCGGERDFKKRPLMAKVARSLCKNIYVTDDNPRNENPNKIRKEIISQLKNSNHFNFGSRSEAIKKAILRSEPNEIILVAGKGHENTQDYGNEIISISDKNTIKKIKVNKEFNNLKKQNYSLNSKIFNKLLNNKKIYKFEGVSIDSREIKKGNLFIAFKGKNNDGNKFIPNAIKKGVNHIVSSKKNNNFQKKMIIVKNPINFLCRLAILKREACNAKILAITGSVGKTSLKNMLSNLLQNFGKTYASPKSFNNHFGVPLSLSNLNLIHKFGIFEVGMSKPGEINQLSKMIKPDLAIITNIAEAHIENFKNIKGIAKAKSEIIDNIRNDGTIFLNRDDKFFNYLNDKAKSKNIKVVTFGRSKNSDVFLEKSEIHDQTIQASVNIKGEILKLNIKGINIYNVLVSLAVLKELNLDIKNIKDIFSNLTPSEGRGKIHKINRYKKNFSLVDESYNASPMSVKNALKFFSKLKKRNFKKYLLLGDMLELGKKSKIYHSELSRLINRSDIDKVFVKGEKTLFTYKKLKKEKRGNILQCNQDVDFILQNIIANNDYLMIKGSNATGLNKISNLMIKGNLNVI